MNLEEFLKKDEPASTPVESAEEIEEAEISENIDVQKAVVESLAADKAILAEKISELGRENAALKIEVARLNGEISSLKAKLVNEGEITSIKNELVQLRAKCAEQVAALAKVGDVLARNSETTLSNKVSLLDRDTDVPDRFPGETREHVLEVIAEARKSAEADGRLRRAQILEGVLLANESEGTLAERRAELEKLFAENANIISGPVIEALEKMGIAHKNGEEYLLPSEILKRTY